MAGPSHNLSEKKTERRCDHMVHWMWVELDVLLLLLLQALPNIILHTM